MSKGISKLQRAIVGVLDGTAKRQCFSGGAGGLQTGELVEEMVAAGLVGDSNRKAAMFTVWRACGSLHRRGLISGVYSRTDNGDQTVTWQCSLGESPS